MVKLIAIIGFSFLFQNLFGQFTTESVLNQGQFIKIAVSEPGVYRIDHNWLQSNGISANNIASDGIRVFGHGGFMLPEDNAVDRFDDLRENSIWMEDGGDGTFGPGDYFLFYAPGQDQWYYDETKGYFRMKKNIYEDAAYYMVQLDGSNGLRITTRESSSTGGTTSLQFMDHQRLEEDKVNLLGKDAIQQGSGKQWFGDELSNTRTAYYPDHFIFPNIRTDQEAFLESVFAGRCAVSSRFEIELEQQTFSQRVSSTNLSYQNAYARNSTLEEAFNPQGDNIAVRVNYDQVSSPSQGWLDYIQINAWRETNFQNTPMLVKDPRSLTTSTFGFEFSGNTGSMTVWDVTDPTRVIHQNMANSKPNSFYYEVDTLRQFYVFNASGNTLTPDFVSEVENQNLHGIEDLDMLIVYHKDFEEQANRLAEHRSNFGGLFVETVDVEDIYNEFASGSADPTAIRDFARMLHERSPTFRFLLLFGDGSYDYRHRVKETDPQNFVPTFQSDNSLDPIYAYPSDDYFGLLDRNEGSRLRGALDIAVGRLPVRTAAEAKVVVDKIIKYETDPELMGDWRMQLTFIADDEDGSQHMDQCELVAKPIQEEYPMYNQKKIYFDAFEQTSLAGGDRYPEATDEINRSVFKGSLSMVYLGHGGPTGWAQERVLKVEDINSWSNNDHYPILVTATCSFTGFDDPAQTTAGEYALLNPNGGMVGLLSTVRLVYSTDNFRLTKAVHDRMFEKPFGQRPYLGEILKEAKNGNPADTLYANSRKFFLFGDPATPLAIPQQYVYTSKINGVDADQQTDTLRAMETVTIEGYVGNENGDLLSDFNGTLYATVYDKAIELKTLGNDPGSFERAFKLQTNTLFKGTVSVTNGEFSLQFVMPKDINYQFGNGKISFYAADTSRLMDAGGYFNDIIIGGTDPNAPLDDIGPLVEVFMNDTLFRDGGITGRNPVLLARISDDNGINITGNNIGHDLLGILDGNTQQAFVLNDFFISEKDDYTKGSVRFPLSNLEEGDHFIEVRAWDIANNLGVGTLNFTVIDGAKGVIRSLSAFPNPFLDETTITFEHNLERGQLEMFLEIFDLNGRKVTEIAAQADTDSYRNNALTWNATNRSGGAVGTGMYLYRVMIKYTGNNGVEKIITSDTEKLLFIR